MPFQKAVKSSGMGILLLPLCLFLVSCSTTSYKGAPDFSVAESRLDLAHSVANPEAKAHIEEAKKQFKAAKDLCLTNTEQLEEAVKERNEAVKEAQYWKAKQRKALKELWFWRGALIVAVLFAARGPILWLVRKFVGIPW